MGEGGGRRKGGREKRKRERTREICFVLLEKLFYMNIDEDLSLLSGRDHLEQFS